MRYLAGSILLLGAWLLSGCASDQRSDALTHTMIEYGNAIRWDGFEAGMQFVDPKVREQHPVTDLDRARFKQVTISDYDDGNGPQPDGKDDVRQTVTIGLTNVHTQTVRSITVHQSWHYDEAKRRWWLESGIPDLNQAE